MLTRCVLDALIFQMVRFTFTKANPHTDHKVTKILSVKCCSITGQAVRPVKRQIPHNFFYSLHLNGQSADYLHSGLDLRSILAVWYDHIVKLQTLNNFCMHEFLKVWVPVEMAGSDVTEDWQKASVFIITINITLFPCHSSCEQQLLFPQSRTQDMM